MAEPVLKRGSDDPAVKDLQEALKTLGYDPGAADGRFGAQTEAAVKTRAIRSSRRAPPGCRCAACRAG